MCLTELTLEYKFAEKNLLLFFSRPEKLNAINKEMWKKLGDLLEEYCFSNKIKSIVVTGKGRFFSAGDDIKEMYKMSSISDSDSFFELIKRTLINMIYCQKPIVAALNGPAVGGGAEILFFFDHVVAVKDAWLSFPETKISLIPPVFNVLSPLFFGTKKAFFIARRGEKITSLQAREIGLIDEVVDDKEILLERAIEAANKLSLEHKQEISLKTNYFRLHLENILSNINLLKTLVLTRTAKKYMNLFLEKRRQ